MNDFEYDTETRFCPSCGIEREFIIYDVVADGDESLGQPLAGHYIECDCCGYDLANVHSLLP